MEVVNPRSALLSNFEVLSLLRELENEQLAETRAALAVKKEQPENDLVDQNTFLPNQPPTLEVCENLRTVEFEAIAHLSASFQPSVRQTAQGIRKLIKALAPYELTKSEKLQIVNLAPTELVELYVIVEELEDRLSDKIEEILATVRASLSESTIADSDLAPEPETIPETHKVEDLGGEIVGESPYAVPDVQEDWLDDSGMMEFVDTEGVFDDDLEIDEADE